jgi:hypothetical protein
MLGWSVWPRSASGRISAIEPSQGKGSRRSATRRLKPDALIDELRKLLTGPQQREAQRLSRESLGEDLGDNA